MEPLSQRSCLHSGTPARNGFQMTPIWQVGYFRWPATGAQILWRASASFTLKPVKVLADGTYLAQLKPPGRRPRRRSAWSPICSILGVPGAGPGLRLLNVGPAGPGQPRKTKKAGDFPAHKPGAPSMTSSKPRSTGSPATGEELVEGAGENSSLPDRPRKEIYANPVMRPTISIRALI